MNNTIINRVANSELETIDLENFLPQNHILSFDIKEYLFQGLLLKEKDFRQFLKDLNWSIYDNTIVAIFCSTDAIIPRWAYMIIASYLEQHALYYFAGSVEETIEQWMLLQIERIDISSFEGKKIIIKGCSDKQISAKIYTAITQKLLPHAQSIMYGEACSSVPVFKRKKKIDLL